MFPVAASVSTRISSLSELCRVDFTPGKAANLSLQFSFVVCLYPSLLRLMYIFCFGGFSDVNKLLRFCLSGGLFDCFSFTTGGSATAKIYFT